jgi:CheY-like chemotaxis protein
MKALVVDDSAFIRKVIIGALTRADIVDADQAADGVEALKAGAQNYIIKPFEPATIIDKINQTINKG